MPPDYRISFRHFKDMGVHLLYDVLKLRYDVFVLEQRSFYTEIDGADRRAVHAAVNDGDDVVGTLRILGLDGLSDISIGRVAVHADHRGTGLARGMMRAALSHIEFDAPNRDVMIGAQSHLEDFYSEFGFVRTSEEYLDGGILHVEMKLERSTDQS